MKIDKLQIYNKDYFDVRLGLVDLYLCKDTNKLYAQKQLTYKNKLDFEKHYFFYLQRLNLQNIPIQTIYKCEKDENLFKVIILFDYPQNDLFDFYEELQNPEKFEIFLIQALQAINYLDENEQVHGNIRHEFFQYQKKSENFQLIDNFDNQRYSKDKAQENFEDLIFLSPQYFYAVANNEKFKGNLVKEDIFCLGLIALYLFEDIDEVISIYDFENRKFDKEKFQQLKGQMSFKNEQTYLEILIKEQMLCENEENRITPQEALQIISKKDGKQKSVANYSFDYSKNWVQELQGSDTTYVIKSLRSIPNTNKLSLNKDKDFNSIKKIDSRNVEQQFQSHKYIDDQKKSEIAQFQSNLRSLNDIKETEKKIVATGAEIIYKQIGELNEQNLKADSKKFDRYSFGYFSQNQSDHKLSKASDIIINVEDLQNQKCGQSKLFEIESSQNEDKIFRSEKHNIQKQNETIQNIVSNPDNNFISIKMSKKSSEKDEHDYQAELISLDSNSMKKLSNSLIQKSNTNDAEQISDKKSENQNISSSQNQNEQEEFKNYGLLSENSSFRGVMKSQENPQNYENKNLLTNEFENMDLLSIDNTEMEEKNKQQRFRESEIKSIQQIQKNKKPLLMDTQFYEDDTIKQSKVKKTLGFGRNKNSKRSNFFDHQIETGGESFLDGSMSVIVNKNISKIGLGLNRESENRFQGINTLHSRDNSYSQAINDSTMKENLQSPANNSIKEENDMESQIDDPRDYTSNNNSSLQPQKKYSSPQRDLNNNFQIQIPKKRMSENVQMMQKIHIFQRPSRKSAMNNLLKKEVNSLKSSFSNLELDEIGNTLISSKKDVDYQIIQKDIDKYVKNYFTDHTRVGKIDSKKIQNKIFDQLLEKKNYKNRRSSKQLQQIKWMVNSRVNVELVQKKKFSLQESSQYSRPRIATIKEESIDINASEIRPQTNRFKFVDQIDNEIEDEKDFKFTILNNKKSGGNKLSDDIVQKIVMFLQQNFQKQQNDEKKLFQYVKNVWKQNESYQYISKNYIKLKQKFFAQNKKFNEFADNIKQQLSKICKSITQIKNLNKKLERLKTKNKKGSFQSQELKIFTHLQKNKKLQISIDLNIFKNYKLQKQYQKNESFQQKQYLIFKKDKIKPNRKIYDIQYFKNQKTVNFCNYFLQESQISQYSESVNSFRENILQKKRKKNYQTFSSQIIKIKSSANNSIKQIQSEYHKNEGVQLKTISQQNQFSPLTSTINIETQSYEPQRFQNFVNDQLTPLNSIQQRGQTLNFRRVRNQQNNVNRYISPLPIKKNKLKVSGFEKMSSQKNGMKKIQFNQFDEIISKSNLINFKTFQNLNKNIQKDFYYR